MTALVPSVQLIVCVPSPLSVTAQEVPSLPSERITDVPSVQLRVLVPSWLSATVHEVPF